MTKHSQEVQVGIQKLLHKHTEVGGDDVEMGLCSVVNKGTFFYLNISLHFLFTWRQNFSNHPY